MLFDVNLEQDVESPDYVRVEDTVMGKGVAAVRPYPALSVIGEICGRLMEGDAGNDEYTFDFGSGLSLEPEAPFRYLNHSCNPNCEFDVFAMPDENEDDQREGLYLLARRDIYAGEPLTINYNWPASFAIPCKCGDLDCCGWVVAAEELHELED